MNPPSSEEPDTIGSVWAALRRHLDSRFRQSCAELRNYPTPIARCDDQLPKLIEQRDHARDELERMTAIEATAINVSNNAAQRFLSAAMPTDDDAESLLRSRLKKAVERK